MSYLHTLVCANTLKSVPAGRKKDNILATDVKKEQLAECVAAAKKPRRFTHQA